MYDNRKFQHFVKLFLLEKIKYKEAIILLNNENLESNEKEGAKTLNDFFSNVIKNLEVPKDYFEDNLDIR